MKKLDYVIIGISIMAGFWPAFSLLVTIPHNSIETLTSRFSQGFFNVFTAIPLAVFALGSLVLFLALKERRIRDRKVTSRLILIGCVIIFLGFGVFSFYLID